MSRIPYYYDPYDFSDTSTSEDDDQSYMHQDEAGGDVDIADTDFDQGNQDIDMASASGSYSAGSRSTVPTRVTLSAFTGETSSSISSYTRDGSTRSSTPESVISMTESLRTRMYREEYGRGLNNYSEVYRLPADEEEWSRLEKQHLMNIDMIGAKYPPPMGPVLQSSIPGEKKVLDLGCGSGAWIRDVARDFPFCEVVGVDLVPIRENEVDDINFGLAHFYNEYDVVHCRLIAAGITDYRLLVDRIARVLRPGGMIELMEYDFHTYDRHARRVPVSIEESRLGPPWWARFLGHVRAATKAQGGDTEAATHIHDWVTNCGAFENVSYHDFWPPVVPGDDERYNEIVYARMIDIMTAYLASAGPLLRGYGISEEEFDILEQNVLREIHQSNTAQFTRLQCVYATKRHDVLLADDV